MTRAFVVFMLPSFDVGGAERQTLDLLRWLPRRRVRLGLVLARREGPLLGEIPPDVQVWDLGGVGHPQVLAGAVRLARLLARVQPDVVVPRLWFGVCLTHLATRFSSWRGRTVSIEDAMPMDYRREVMLGRLKQRWVRRAHLAGDQVVAVSPSVRDQLTMLGVNGSKVAVCPNGIDVGDIVRRGSQPVEGLPTGRYLVQVGSLKSLKGPDRLISALPSIHESISLVFVGDGPMLPQLERLAAALGVSERVQFVGYQSNPYPFIAQAALLVMPSRIPEAEGLSALEALALGTPVLVPEKRYHLLPTGHPMELTFASEDDADLKRKLSTATAQIEKGVLQRERQELAEHTMESAVSRFTQVVLS